MRKSFVFGKFSAPITVRHAALQFDGRPVVTGVFDHVDK